MIKNYFLFLFLTFVNLPNPWERKEKGAQKVVDNKNAHKKKKDSELIL